jgi:DNA-binding NarL/FixJ family response regulator
LREGALRILIVAGDQRIARSHIDHLPVDLDVEIVGVATTVERGAALAFNTAPDVVVVDHLVGGDDGLDCVRAIRATTPESRPILLAPSADDELFLAALDAGCIGYVVDERELPDAIRTVARGTPAMPLALVTRSTASRPSMSPTFNLTRREMQILGMLAQGMRTKDIAARLALSLSTVRNYTQGAIGKLGAHSRMEAVATAARVGLVRMA